MKKLSKLQQRLYDTRQLKQSPDNSVILEEAQVAVEPEQPKPDLSRLLKRELLAMASELGLTQINSKNTKAQIIAAIQNAD